MNAPAMNIDEDLRIRELLDLGILDSPKEEEYDTLTEIAARFFDVPIVIIGFVDAERLWAKSSVGLALRSIERSLSLCTHGIKSSMTMVVEDTLEDSRFAGNPYVDSDNGIRFYAGAPIMTLNNQAVGMFCLMDTKPRTISQTDLRFLERFARQVSSLLENRRRLTNLTSQIKAVRTLQFGVSDAASRLRP